MKTNTISLWMCKNAIYHQDFITCSQGHDIGKIPGWMARRGKPLVCRACNPCPDYDIMGDDIQKSERGWE